MAPKFIQPHTGVTAETDNPGQIAYYQRRGWDECEATEATEPANGPSTDIGNGFTMTPNLAESGAATSATISFDPVPGGQIVDPATGQVTRYGEGAPTDETPGNPGDIYVELAAGNDGFVTKGYYLREEALYALMESQDSPDQGPAPTFEPERFARPAADAPAKALREFAAAHGIDLSELPGNASKTVVSETIETYLSGVETEAAARGIEVEGRYASDVAKEIVEHDETQAPGQE